MRPADDSTPHGYHGDRGELPAALVPLAASVAISREVGARGADIARRLGTRLGWPVYDAEVLGYSAQDDAAFDEQLAELPAIVRAWVEKRQRFLRDRGLLVNDPSFERVARMILALGAKGEAIFVGRGAGFLLPRHSTLHVRLTAPLRARVAYMAQSLRLSRDEAGELLAERDAKRAEFLARCFRLPDDGMTFDATLNSSSLGEDLCTELIVAALECKRRPPLTDGSGILV